MSDLTEYASVGDIDGPFELTANHHRSQREREALRDSMRCTVRSLTWEEYRAGAPCPGCGRPYVDEEAWDFRGTMHLNEQERTRYDAEQDRFRADHPDCRSARHGVSGSLTTHCTKCCPTPPLSPKQIQDVARLLSRPSTPPHDLIRWRLRLYCGHIVDDDAHRTHTNVHAAFTGAVRCTECGLDPATIIDGLAVGSVAEAPTPPTTIPRRKPTRQQLERWIEELKAELEKRPRE